jgi:hypothetical protein
VANDWYVEKGEERLAQISAARAQCVADLEAAKARYDDDGAVSAIQSIADLDAQRTSLLSLYQQYWNSMNPPAPPEPSPEERAAKPLSRMDYGDVYEMLKHSKYGVDDNAFRAGIAEVQRRRARGE